jgi:endonuclease/exonuclease/phosphatase family metal-dependent hydrolase
VNLHLVCIHFGFLSLERRPQIRRLCRHIEHHIPHAEPLILAGDFNDWSARAEREINTELGLVEVFRALHGRYAKTFPAWAPALPMDRIYCRGVTPVAAARLSAPPWPSLSDHTPLQAWFRL